MIHGTRRASAVALALTLLLGVAGPALAGGNARLSGTVNVNTATAEQLQMLPGIGETRAQALLEQRERQGRFQRIDDLLAVKGIGGASLEALRPYVTLQGATTAKLE